MWLSKDLQFSPNTDWLLNEEYVSKLKAAGFVDVKMESKGEFGQKGVVSAYISAKKPGPAADQSCCS